VAQRIDDDRAQVKALVAVAAHSNEARRASLLDKALEPAERIEEMEWQAEALVAVAAHSDEARRASLLDKALDVAQRIDDDRGRVRALVAVAAHLDEGRRASALDKALETARRIQDDRWRADCFLSLIPNANIEQLLEMLRLANQMEDADCQYQVQSRLSRRFADVSPGVLHEVWHSVLPGLAARHRPQLLLNIASFSEVISSLGGLAALRETTDAVNDVGRWWP
jgi:hypothetical protein